MADGTGASMIVGRIPELSNYLDAQTFDIVRTFLSDVYEGSLSDGVYPLGDGVVAKIMTYALKNESDCNVEVHKHHIDIQATLSGVEGISIFDPNDVGSYGHYDSEGDVSFSSDVHGHPIVRIDNRVGLFSLIYPGEPHRPMEYRDGQSVNVRKFVIKIDAGVHNA